MAVTNPLAFLVVKNTNPACRPTTAALPSATRPPMCTWRNAARVADLLE